LLRARALGETGPELAWWLGQAHEAGNEFSRAVEAYGQAADEAEPGTELRNRAWKAKGRMALAAGEPAAAVAAFEQLRAAASNDVEARLWLSRACQAAGLEAQALEEARAAAEMDPTSVEAATQWAASAHEFGEVEEAISASKKLAQLTPANATVWLDLGNLLDRAGNRDEAREAAARAVAAAHKDPAVLRKTADLLAKLDDVPAAERLLETRPTAPRRSRRMDISGGIRRELRSS
jgi:tetratricopeptide (TPR) repeat protein